MNKRQRKKQERKCAGARPPWAGRFTSSIPSDDVEEVYVVYVARPVIGEAERQISEYQVFPYAPEFNVVLASCRELIDRFLAEFYRQGMTPDELFARYRHEGPDPYIRYEERGGSEYFTSSIAVSFNAWGYTEIACRSLCGQEPGKPSRSLALWKGRYQAFDRKRMESQLLLRRRVRLTRECSGMIGLFPAGIEGIIGMHAYYIGASCFDWSIELPVIFDVADERGQVTFGIPYDALEFVESDEEYMQSVRRNLNEQK